MESPEPFSLGNQGDPVEAKAAKRAAITSTTFSLGNQGDPVEASEAQSIQIAQASGLLPGKPGRPR